MYGIATQAYMGSYASRNGEKERYWKSEKILKGVEKTFSKAKRTGHNEVTRWYDDGTVVVRFYETDIVRRYPSGAIEIDTGGWPTVSTRTHINDALAALGCTARVCQRNQQQWVSSKWAQYATLYVQRATINPNGTVATD